MLGCSQDAGPMFVHTLGVRNGPFDGYSCRRTMEGATLDTASESFVWQARIEGPKLQRELSVVRLE